MSTQLINSKKKRTAGPAANSRNGAAPSREIVINDQVHIPAWVMNHDGFRRWAFSEEFPRRGRFGYFAGKLWVDLSMETDDHNQIKTIIAIIVGSLILDDALGRYYSDRMLLTHPDIKLSSEPDGMFVSNEALKSGQAKLLKGGDSLEVRGAADMVLEVVSKYSVEKDTVILMEQYAKAGIPEYWLVDSTSEAPELVILRLVNGKYAAVRKSGGWAKSRVFGRSFRLTSTKDSAGLSQFNLETK